MITALLLTLAQFGQARTTTFQLAGRTVRCNSAERIYDDTKSPHTAFAETNSMAIVINTDRMKSLKDSAKWFIFYHECGHLEGIRGELEADESAAEVASREGWMSAELVEEICKFSASGAVRGRPLVPDPKVRCKRLRDFWTKKSSPQNSPPSLLPRPLPKAVR